MHNILIRIIIVSIILMILLLNYKKIKDKILNRNKLVFIVSLGLLFIDILIRVIFEYQSIINIIVSSIINPIYVISFAYLIISKKKS
ncbi:Uncharacterised protein [Clostridium putrefaciens]|uniref:Uncharacterized protein n=1 Tax=Clostridium putrefaciens TaxID=99675 RepID=A0A381JAD0_9CLOT|nr:hypothetical protein [Clostridium putrefaciens]SUY48065.1 Uncharacterised protein [Clostridium putrefaciens]